MHHARKRLRFADLGLEHVAAVGAFEQEQVGPAHEQPLGNKVEKARRRAPGIMQAAAMRRVDADARARRCKPRIGSALGAVTVHHIRSDGASAGSDMHAGRNITKSDVPAHGNARDPEREVRGELRKPLLPLHPAGRDIRHEPHTMSQCRLRACKIEYVAEEPAHGCAQHMQDVETAIRHRSASLVKLMHAGAARRVCTSPCKGEVSHRRRSGSAPLFWFTLH